jgi:hypothetical protein
MIADNTVTAGLTRAVLRYAAERGADRTALLEVSGLRGDCLDDPDSRVPLAQFMALMKACVSHCRDPVFALRFGEVVHTEDLSVALMVAGAAQTVEQARVQVNRFSRLIHDGGHGEGAELLQLGRDRYGTWLQFRSGSYVDNPYLLEVGLTWCVREMRRMMALHFPGRPFLHAIHFAYPEPDYRAEYDRVFGVPLFFGSDRTAMRVDERFLSLQMPASSSYVSRVLGEHAEKLLARLAKSKTLRSQVERLLTARLSTGQTAVHAVARTLGISRQTLYRRLRSEGVTFEKVLDGLRRELAQVYLQQQRLSVK